MNFGAILISQALSFALHPARWVTGLLVRKGKPSETRASAAKGSPIASLFASTSGDSVAPTTGTTERIPNAKMVVPKTIWVCLILFNCFSTKRQQLSRCCRRLVCQRFNNFPEPRRHRTKSGPKR
jgi:hypothetical protein